MHRFLESRVADYMTRAVVTVTPETAIGALEKMFIDHDFNGLPVLDGERLVGIVTKLDLLKVFVFTTKTVVPPYEDLAKRPAREFMTRAVVTFSPETPLTRVLQALVDSRVKSYPVLEGGVLVGIIAREDVVRALRDAAGTTGGARAT